MASTRVTRTVGTPTAHKFTFSAWVKRSQINDRQRIFTVINPSATSSYGYLEFASDNKLTFDDFNGGSDRYTRTSDGIFRDTNAWYHIVCMMDTTAGSNALRAKIYVNGSEIPYSATDNGSLSSLSTLSSGKTFYLGSHSSSMHFEGCMSHVHFIDGTVYTPSTFGETDSATGFWKIKANPGITQANYGNNGFFIFKDTNNLVTDQSGNSNNFTVSNGTLTATVDSPSNNFPIANRYYYFNGAYNDYSNSGLTVQTGSGATGVTRATLGASSGKYYWEVKIGASDGAGNIWQGVGIVGDDNNSSTDELGNTNYQIGYWGNDGTIRKNNTNLSTGTTFTTNDIIGVAMDLDNNKIYFHKNGSYVNTVSGYQGNPTTGQYGFDITANPPDQFYFPAWGDWDNNNRYYFHLNFGNGYFGSTQITSEGNNASNNGKFEYDVPTGYTALSTKGLNT